MNPSYRVIQLVKEKISTEHLKASDTDVARVLHISRAAVSAYKNERDVMSQHILERAQQILDLDYAELSELSMMLLLASTPEIRAIHAAHQWMIDQAKNFEPQSPDPAKARPADKLRKGVAMLALVATSVITGFSGESAHARASFDLPNNVYYGNKRKRALNRSAALAA